MNSAPNSASAAEDITALIICAILRMAPLLGGVFAAVDSIQSDKHRAAAVKGVPRNALQAYLHSTAEAKTGSGFQRIQKCREALEALDRQGWQRSFHQRLFHDHFIRACARIFWKTEKPGSFARDHQKILEMNGWDHLSQEVLVSTPRRYNLLLNLTRIQFTKFIDCAHACI